MLSQLFTVINMLYGYIDNNLILFLLWTGSMLRLSSLATNVAWGTNMKTQPSSILRDAKRRKMPGTTLARSVPMSTRYDSCPFKFLFSLGQQNNLFYKLLSCRPSASEHPLVTNQRNLRSALSGVRLPDLMEVQELSERYSSPTSPLSLWATVFALWVTFVRFLSYSTKLNRFLFFQMMYPSNI